jgi:SAM-dependent methyltransferase/glycosyltransferase involved in cell wall biosynthesis
VKIIIRNPAPLGKNQRKWGDFHFGRSLAKYFERHGAQVVTQYHEEWDQPNDADVVLVLRGKYRYRPHGSTRHVMWCMSNPSTVFPDECNDYDAVCVASTTHAERLKQALKIPVFPLLQCTDPEEFESLDSADGREGYIFVGNSRGVKRPCIDWAVQAGVDLKIYGRGWEDFGLKHAVAGEYIRNEDLPALYRRSRLTLNDHWRDMKNMGYVNNRVFDCLAAGLPLLTDDFPELRDIAGDELLYYSDEASFRSALQFSVDNYADVIASQQRLWRRIRSQFSFESRAIFLMSLFRDVIGQAPRATRPTVASKLQGDPFEPGRMTQVREQLAQKATGYYCPICGTHSAAFRSGGVASKRPNAKCPSCGALERHRLFWLYFVNDLYPKLPADRMKQLLHVAPEAYVARPLHEADDINYLSGDLFMPNVMVKLDLTQMEFPDKRFDVIICSHILEHIPDDVKAMREMFRTTRPGGYVIVMVPLYGGVTYEDWSITTPEDRLRHFGQDDHVRKYGRDIEDRLRSAGFSVTARTYRSEVGPQIAQCLALKEQVIFECQRPH